MSIASELTALIDETGMLIAEDAVTWAAEHPGSDLHQALEWDGPTAAHQYRLHQVRCLVAVHVRDAETGQRSMVSLVMDRKRDGGGYRRVGDVMRNRELREMALAEAHRELQRLQARYDHLTELAAVWIAAERARRPRRPPAGDDDRPSA